MRRWAPMTTSYFWRNDRASNANDERTHMSRRSKWDNCKQSAESVCLLERSSRSIFLSRWVGPGQHRWHEPAHRSVAWMAQRAHCSHGHLALRPSINRLIHVRLFPSDCAADLYESSDCCTDTKLHRIGRWWMKWLTRWDDTIITRTESLCRFGRVSEILKDRSTSYFPISSNA